MDIGLQPTQRGGPRGTPARIVGTALVKEFGRTQARWIAIRMRSNGSGRLYGYFGRRQLAFRNDTIYSLPCDLSGFTVLEYTSAGGTQVPSSPELDRAHVPAQAVAIDDSRYNPYMYPTGSRVEVWWPGDQQWYVAKVTDTRIEAHKIKGARVPCQELFCHYELDDHKQWHSLHNNKIRAATATSQDSLSVATCTSASTAAPISAAGAASRQMVLVNDQVVEVEVEVVQDQDGCQEEGVADEVFIEDVD